MSFVLVENIESVPDGLHHLSLAGNDLSSIHSQLLANGIVRLGDFQPNF